MQISHSSTHNSSQPRSREEIPKGKRAQAIKWTEQEWADIAASIYLTDSTLLEEAGLEKIKARHVFEAQQSCLPRSRQRQLISIAQDFCNKREKIIQTMLQMRQGKSQSGMTLRPAFGPRDTTAASRVAESVAVADDPTPTGELAGTTAEQSSPGSRNGLVMLARSGSDSVTWAPEEWAIVARALLDGNPAVRDGKGEEGIDAQGIYAAQDTLPEPRRRDLLSIQTRLVDDCARLRNILDVLRANMPATTTASPHVVERRVPGTIFRADSSGNGFTRFTPKSLTDAYPGHRIVTAEDSMQFSGVKRKGPSFKIPFPKEIEPVAAYRPEVEQAIAEVFGPPPEESASSDGAQATVQRPEPPGDESSVLSGGSRKRPFIRWDENEWRQVARTLIAQAGGNTDPEKQGFITPLAVHAAQSGLQEERRRTVGSVYSGFASTKEKLSEIVKEVAIGSRADTPGVFPSPLLAQDSSAAEASVSAGLVQADAVSVPAAHYSEPVPAAATADAESLQSPEPSPVYETGPVEMIRPAQDPATITEIVRPFVRMICEEFWDAIARHVSPPGAAYFEEKNDTVC